MNDKKKFRINLGKYTKLTYLNCVLYIIKVINPRITTFKKESAEKILFVENNDFKQKSPKIPKIP